MKYYLVCSIHRSGSQYFNALLNYLELGHVRELFDDKNYRSMDVLVNERIRNNTWGAICHRLFFRKLIDNIRRLTDINNETDAELLNTVFPGIRYIYLTRGNKLRRAISHVKSGQRLDKDPMTFSNYYYSKEEIEKHLKQHAIYESYWEDFFLNNNIVPLRIVYEEMVANPLLTLENVLEFLDIKQSINVNQLKEFINSPGFPQKLSDRLSEEWVAQYLEESKCPGK